MLDELRWSDVFQPRFVASPTWIFFSLIFPVSFAENFHGSTLLRLESLLPEFIVAVVIFAKFARWEIKKCDAYSF